MLFLTPGTYFQHIFSFPIPPPLDFNIWLPLRGLPSYSPLAGLGVLVSSPGLLFPVTIQLHFFMS